jgi:hypothetical protein
LDGTTTIELYQLHVGPDEDGFCEVGRAETGVFVSIPAAGLTILESFQDGLTMSGSRERFAALHGGSPDLEEFVSGLLECGFVKTIDGRPPREGNTDHQGGIPRWKPFARLNPRHTTWLLSRPLRMFYAAIWLTTPLLLLFQPHLIPHARDGLLLQDDLANTVVVSVAAWALVFLHELAHALAAQARGHTAAVSLGRRLYFLVGTTDLSGLRAIPRSQRYAPYLAGITFDAAVLFGSEALRIIGFDNKPVRLVAYICLAHILFQFAVFVRTDIYYVLTNLLRVGNLNQDAEHILVNWWCHLRGKPARHDMSSMSERERRIARRYLPVYVVGIGAVLADLVFLLVPLAFEMIRRAAVTALADASLVSELDSIAFLAITAFTVMMPIVIAVSERRQRSRT